MSAATEVKPEDTEARIDPEDLVRHRNKYTEDFRHEAARMVVHGGERLTDVAARFQVSQQTLSNWVRKERTENRRRNTAQRPPVTHQISSAKDQLEIERLRAQLAKEKDRADTFEKTTILLAREKAQSL